MGFCQKDDSDGLRIPYPGRLLSFRTCLVHPVVQPLEPRNSPGRCKFPRTHAAHFFIIQLHMDLSVVISTFEAGLPHNLHVTSPYNAPSWK